MPVPLPDDLEQHLLERIQTDPEAFRDLYRHYLPRVYAYIAYRVGSVPDAEDLTAETFMQIVKALAAFEYRGAGSFAAWVFRIAQHRVAAFYRQRRRVHKVIPLDDLPEITSPSPTPEALIQRQERFLRLQQKLNSLSPRRQEIVTLRFYGGLRNHEIAAVLGLDERTVAAHLSRALEDLQTRYVGADEFLEGVDDE